MGMPESMVRRSAAARAKAQGVEADAVLMEWAGVDPSSTAAATSPAPAVVAAVPAAPAPPAAAESDVEVDRQLEKACRAMLDELEDRR